MYDRRMIVVLTEVPKDEGLQAPIHAVQDELRHHVIRQVTITPHDTLFYRPWIRSDFQHLDIVV